MPHPRRQLLRLPPHTAATHTRPALPLPLTLVQETKAQLLCQVGTEVQARYQGGRRWSKARIMKVWHPPTDAAEADSGHSTELQFNLEYENGDREMRVPKSHLKLL